MKTAIECNEVSKYFTNWERRKKNGSLLSRIFNPFMKEKKRFCAVNRVSLKVGEGEILGVLGANGSGKSTLIRLISTLLLPDDGAIRVFGLNVVENELQVRKMINRVSVEASFFKKLSAWENLEYASWLYGYSPGETRQKLTEIFEKLELPGSKLTDSLQNLSRGMQQKVAIARALFTRPSLLLLDEPTTGLDPRSKRQVQAFVNNINREYGITVLLTTHDMVEAEKLCNRIVIMNKGVIIAEGTAAQLKAKVGSDNTLGMTLEDVFIKLADEAA